MNQDWELILWAGLWVVGTLQWVKNGFRKFYPKKKAPEWAWWILTTLFCVAAGTLMYYAPKQARWMVILSNALTILSVSQIGYEVFLKRIRELVGGIGAKKGGGNADA